MKKKDVYKEIGRVYAIKDEYDPAIKKLNKAINDAIEIGREDIMFYKERGRIYTIKGEYDAAITDLNKAIEIDPDDAVIYRFRARVYADKGEYKTAMTDLNKAIEIDPEDAKTYKERGIVYTFKGEYEAAMKDLNKAIELDPEDAGAYKARGIVYDKTAEHDAAIKDLNKAIEFNPADEIRTLKRSVEKWRLLVDPWQYEDAEYFPLIKKVVKCLEDKCAAILADFDIRLVSEYTDQITWPVDVHDSFGQGDSEVRVAFFCILEEETEYSYDDIYESWLQG